MSWLTITTLRCYWSRENWTNLPDWESQPNVKLPFSPASRYSTNPNPILFELKVSRKSNREKANSTNPATFSFMFILKHDAPFHPWEASEWNFGLHTFELGLHRVTSSGIDIETSLLGRQRQSTLGKILQTNPRWNPFSPGFDFNSFWWICERIHIPERAWRSC